MKGFNQCVKKKKGLEMNEELVSRLIQEQIVGRLEQNLQEIETQSVNEPQITKVQGEKLLSDLTRNKNWIKLN